MNLEIKVPTIISTNIQTNIPYCICNQSNVNPLIECHSVIKKCHGFIHPQCFHLTENEIQYAMNSLMYVCPLCAGEMEVESKKRKRVGNSEEENEENEEFEPSVDSSDYHSDDVGDFVVDDSEEIEEESYYAKKKKTALKPSSIVLRERAKKVYVESDFESDSVDDNLNDLDSDKEEFSVDGRSDSIMTPVPTPNTKALDELSYLYHYSDEIVEFPLIDKIMGRRLKLKGRELTFDTHPYASRLEEYISPSERDEYEYLIKWKRLSYIHCCWIYSDMILADGSSGKSKYSRFIQSVNSLYVTDKDAHLEIEDFIPSSYIEPDRVLAVSDPSPDIRWTTACNRLIYFFYTLERDGYLVASGFIEPVDTVLDNAPNYYSIIKNPMNFSQMSNKLTSNEYHTPEEFRDDFLLMIHNCEQYNTDANCYIRKMALILLNEFNAQFPAIATDYHKRKPLEEIEPTTLKKIHYLVKWVGLPYNESTWELEEDIESDLKIAQFRRRNANVPHRKLKKKGGLSLSNKTAPITFKGNRELRVYQREGFQWIIQHYLNNQNCILADEMGLGKTVQSIAVCQYLITRLDVVNPILIVAPLSTLGFWKSEIESWTDINVVVYHDSRITREVIRYYEWFYDPKESNAPYDNIHKFDVILTSYEIVLSDLSEFLKFNWSLLIVDEAQRLKSQTTKLQSCLHQIKWKQCVLLSGTPLQNNMTELWTLLNFVSPNKFSSKDTFLDEYGNMDNSAQVTKLRKILQVYVLRRLKEDVEQSIPPKEETVIDVELTTIQKQYYRAIYDKNRDFLRTGSNVHSGSHPTGRAPSLINIDMQLRKCCNHPYLLEGVEDREMLDALEYEKNLIATSGKMVLLNKLLRKLFNEGHKLLIFSQMTHMLDILQEYCLRNDYKFERLDGSVRGHLRDNAIDRFNNPNNNIFLFLLSTRAGGVGINLTSADTVIIYDSDWNPQNDIQAEARCHRIGQTKSVKIYRLITRNTYESSLFQRASIKLGLEQAIMSGNNKKKLDSEEIELLLKEGAYYQLIEDQNQEEASKVFCEADIDELLAQRSRVINHNKEKSETTDTNNTRLFNKTVFASQGADRKLDVNDPDFWKKVFGKDTRETMLSRLDDGTATETPESIESFVQEFQSLAQEIINEKLEGNPTPMYYDNLVMVLTQVVNMKKAFSVEQRAGATNLLKEIEKPTRNRHQVSTINTGELDDFEEEVKKKTEHHVPNIYADDVCCVCLKYTPRYRENTDTADDNYVISCKGTCGRIYHKICYEKKFDSIPRKLRDHGIVCENCKESTYTCRGCNKETVLKVSAKNNQANITQCNVPECNVYYHKKCLKKFSKTIYNSRTSTFKCALHYCKKCNARQKGLITCIKCANAYHFNCLTDADGTRISPHRILCYKHRIPEGLEKYTRPVTVSSGHKHHHHNQSKPTEIEFPPLSESPIVYDVAYENYHGDWCRYCGARQSSGWNCGPWGSKTLCVSHYVKWRQKKSLDLSHYPELPTTPIAPSENTEKKYLYGMKIREFKACNSSPIDGGSADSYSSSDDSSPEPDDSPSFEVKLPKSNKKVKVTSKTKNKTKVKKVVESEEDDEDGVITI